MVMSRRFLKAEERQCTATENVARHDISPAGSSSSPVIISGRVATFIDGPQSVTTTASCAEHHQQPGANSRAISFLHKIDVIIVFIQQ